MRRSPTFLALAAAATLAAGCGSSHGSSRPLDTSSPTTSTAPSANSPSASAPAGVADWPTYHRTADRAGNDPAAARFRHFTSAWSAKLDGQAYAEPLIVAGRAIVATENDSVYALDLHSGRVVWRTHVGTAVPLDSLPCGNIDPLGITGTPAYDAASRTLFVAAEVTGPRHQLVALDPATGAVRWRKGLDVVGGHAVAAQQQRGALVVAGGRVYVPFGGLYGDCGDYVGYVAGVATSGRGGVSSWVVPTKRQGGIWAPPGVSAIGGSLYVTIGNSAATGGGYDGGDSVAELSPALRRTAFFAPRSWADDNSNDLDLGSSGPVLLPGGRLVQFGKRGAGYLLDATHLGGVGAQLATAGTCRSFGGAAVLGQRAFLPCTQGLQALDVTRSSMRFAWQSSVAGSPVVGGGVVYAVDIDSGTLHAIDPATGKDRGTIAVGGTSRFTTPTLSGSLVLVGTLAGVTAVSVS